MDGKGTMSFINRWFLESSESTCTNALGLPLISSTLENPLLDRGFSNNPSPALPYINGGPFHHPRVGGISEPNNQLNYWMPHDKEVFPNDLSTNHQQHQYNSFHQQNYGASLFPPVLVPDPSIQMLQQVSPPCNDNAILQMLEPGVERGHVISESGGGPVKKRGGGAKLPSKEKKPRTQKDKPTPTTESSKKRAPKKRAEVEINGITMDISGMPIPICTCTGTPRQCYRWGSGGWQSSCCTNSMSSYPLPCSTRRRGTRIAGRKMSLGGFRKVLERLALEGCDFSAPIDLTNCWAKHGTNKFVTIR